MSRLKITPEKIQQIQELRAQKFTLREIERIVGVSYTVVYTHTQLKKKGFASHAEYQEHLAQKRGFASDAEYQKYLAQERGFASHTEYRDHLAQKKGFASRVEYEKNLVQDRGFASDAEYRKHLAQERGFASDAEYRKHLAQERGFASDAEYQKYLAQEKGFASHKEYQKYLNTEKQQRPENQSLTNLIQQRLEELDKDKSWLAQEIGVSRQVVSKYFSGKSIPRKDVLDRLFSSLGVTYKTIDDLLEEK